MMMMIFIVIVIIVASISITVIITTVVVFAVVVFIVIVWSCRQRFELRTARGYEGLRNHAAQCSGSEIVHPSQAIIAARTFCVS